MTTRPSFRPIGAPLEVSDAALEKLNEKLGVPALVNPASRKPISGQNLSQDSAKPGPRPSPTRKPEKRASEAPAGRPVEPAVRLSVYIPAYVSEELNIRAAKERSTSRHIVMQALLALGFEIDPADLFPDGRRQTHKRS
jgi:hypothetical protein